MFGSNCNTNSGYNSCSSGSNSCGDSNGVPAALASIQATDCKILAQTQAIGMQLVQQGAAINSVANCVNTTNNNVMNVGTEVHEIRKLQKADYLITRAMIGTTGYVITQPGTYQLVDDLVGPTAFNPPAFTPANAAFGDFSTGTGSGAAGYFVVSGGVVRALRLTSRGSGYTPNSTFPVTVSAGGGAGTGATAFATTNAAGQIASVTITNGGSGYTNTVIAAITIASGNVNLILADKILQQSGINPDGTANATQRPYTVGILIPDPAPTRISGSPADVNYIGYQSIYINGDEAIIDGFSMFGIRAFAHLEDLQFENITVKNTGALADPSVRPPGYNPTDSVNVPSGTLSTNGPAVFDIAGIQIGESIASAGGSQFFTVNGTPPTRNSAVLQGVITNGVLSINVVSPGSGYTAPPEVVVNTYGGIDTGVTAVATLNASGGVQSVTVTNQGTVPPGGPVFISVFSTTVQPRVFEVKLKNLTVIRNFMHGLVLDNVTDTTVEDCRWDETYSTDPGTQPVGVALGRGNFASQINNVVGLYWSNTTVNKTTLSVSGSTPATPSGGYPVNGAAALFHVNSRDLNFRNSHFDETATLIYTLGGTAGITGGQTNSLKLINCTIDNTSAIGGSVEGFHISGTYNENTAQFVASAHDLVLEDVFIRGVYLNTQLISPAPATPTFSNSWGFYNAYAKNVKMQRVVVDSVISNGPLADGSGMFGYFITSGGGDQPLPGTSTNDYVTESNLLQDCTASRVQTLHGGSAMGYFFLNVPEYDPANVANIRNFLLQNCTAFRIETAAGASGTQGVAMGYHMLYAPQSPDLPTLPIVVDAPFRFERCKALRVRGAPSFTSGDGIYSFFATPVTVYSSGFNTFSGTPGLPSQIDLQLSQRHEYDHCVAERCVYGFMWQGVRRYAVRKCIADNNVDDTGLIGEGFTDLGNSVAPVNPPVTGPFQVGTPAAVTFSDSTFENNRAFNNGPQTTHLGPNGNYNVKYRGAFGGTNFPITEIYLNAGQVFKSGTDIDNISVLS